MFRQMLITLVMLLGVGQSGLAQPLPAPINIHPDPNPLQVPTRSEAVRIRYQVPLTLQEALDLAKRNNPQLRSAEFQVDRSRAQLQEVQSGNRPKLGIRGAVEQISQP